MLCRWTERVGGRRPIAEKDRPRADVVREHGTLAADAAVFECVRWARRGNSSSAAETRERAPQAVLFAASSSGSGRVCGRLMASFTSSG